MSTHVVTMSAPDTFRLREADGRRLIAESGNPGVDPDEARDWVEMYYELLAEFHESYGLDEEEIYEFDAARGAIFRE